MLLDRPSSPLSPRLQRRGNLRSSYWCPINCKKLYKVNTHLTIKANPFLRTWFIIDFIAIFPFKMIFPTSNTNFKLIRIMRLPKFIKILDVSKFDSLLDVILENAAKYVYKIIRLIIIAITLTYFLGCLWYYITFKNFFGDAVESTFYGVYELEKFAKIRRLVMCCYFALTTLSTVGYGDLVPQTNFEKIAGIIIMILGIAFFSYIMGNFNDVLINYDKKMGLQDKGSDLQVWMTSLSKFTNNKPLP